MRISIGVTDYSWPNGPQAFGTKLTRLVEAADPAGVDTVWVADHEKWQDETHWRRWRTTPIPRPGRSAETLPAGLVVIHDASGE